MKMKNPRLQLEYCPVTYQSLSIDKVQSILDLSADWRIIKKQSTSIYFRSNSESAEGIPIYDFNHHGILAASLSLEDVTLQNLIATHNQALNIKGYLEARGIENLIYITGQSNITLFWPTPETWAELCPAMEEFAKIMLGNYFIRENFNEYPATIIVKHKPSLTELVKL